MSPAFHLLADHITAELQRSLPHVGVALYPQLPVGEPTLQLKFDSLRQLHRHGDVTRVQSRLIGALTGLPAHVQALVPRLVATLTHERGARRDAGDTEIAQWVSFSWVSSSYRQTDAVSSTAEVEFEAVALLRLDPAAIEADFESVNS